ncbi:MAG: antA/AntB antirepressor family protein, partial [Burkholderiales bacterium]|nr:antA/AntB antirepressor family protein [Burkholderiales bacterium]
DNPSNPPAATPQHPGQEKPEPHPSSYSFLHDEQNLNLPKATGESSFDHGGQTFRYFFDEHGDGWFNAADIVHYLGYDNVRSKLEEYDITDSRQFIFRGQKALFLSVKGFEKILTESGSPKAGELWDFFINNETSMEKQKEDMEEQKEEAKLEQAFEKGEGFIAEPPSSFRTETSSTAEASNTPSEMQTSGEPKDTTSASQGEDEGQQPLNSTEETSSNPKQDRIFQVYPGFVPEIEAHEIHRKIKTDLTFDQWLDNQIATYGANEGVDYIIDRESGDVYLSSGMTRKIIDAYTADVIARSQRVLDKDVNNVTFQNKVFRFLYDENHNKWYVIEDIQRYLGGPEVQHAIDTYGNPDDPVTVETDVNEYLCFSEETFKKMLANSQNPEIQAIYEGLFDHDKSIEEPKFQHAEEEKVEEKVEEPETEVPTTVREEEFVLTPEPAPSDQSNLDLSAPPSEDGEEKVPSEEEKPEALTVEKAISPKIGTFGGKYFWVVDAKDLHTYLEPPKPYPLWIKDLIDFYGYIENTDYSADREKGVYLLSLPMAREIAMSVPSERSKEVRTYLAAFSEAPIPDLETATSNQTEIPSSEQQEVPQSQEESSYISESAQEIPSEEPVKEGIVAIEEDIVEEQEPEESESEEEQKSEEQAPRKYIRVWTIKGGARELGVGPVFLKAYLEDIGWLFPNTYDPKLYIMRKGLMAYNFGEVTTDAHIGLITEEGLEVLRQKLVRLGIIQFGSPD